MYLRSPVRSTLAISSITLNYHEDIEHHRHDTHYLQKRTPHLLLRNVRVMINLLVVSGSYKYMHPKCDQPSLASVKSWPSLCPPNAHRKSISRLPSYSPFNQNVLEKVFFSFFVCAGLRVWCNVTSTENVPQQQEKSVRIPLKRTTSYP